MKVDKNVIQICMGSSCFSRGNSRNLEIIKDFIKEHDIDANVYMKGHLCAKKCEQGPIIEINGKIYKQVSESGITKILESILL